MNYINPPVFDTNNDRTFLEIIPPTELHLMLGVVNTLYNNLLKSELLSASRGSAVLPITSLIFKFIVT